LDYLFLVEIRLGNALATVELLSAVFAPQTYRAQSGGGRIRSGFGKGTSSNCNFSPPKAELIGFKLSFKMIVRIATNLSAPAQAVYAPVYKLLSVPCAHDVCS
jgi:hypothetical protein